MGTYDVVVFGGSGAVGSLVVALLAGDGSSVLVVDPAPVENPFPGVDYRRGDVLDLDDDLVSEARAASIIVLALPESVAERVPLTHAGPNSLVVETLSVKTGFSTKVLADSSPAEVLGINPMFAPSLGMSGRPVAAVRHRPGPRVDAFLGRITTWGGHVVEVDADTHDRVAAATQALTHASILAFGTALTALDVDPELLEKIAPPPARASLALLARVSGGEPEVYWDAQAGNPHAAAARRALADAVTELDAVVDSGSEEHFTRYLDRAGRSVPDGAGYRALCADLFGIVRGPAREGSRS